LSASRRVMVPLAIAWRSSFSSSSRAFSTVIRSFASNVNTYDMTTFW